VFLGFVIVGLVLGAIHNLLPIRRHLRASAFAVALAGAWFGGYFTAAFVQGTFATMGWVTLVGSVAGAVVHLAAFELVARALVDGRRYVDGW
jgi:hypothetical protein